MAAYLTPTAQVSSHFLCIYQVNEEAVHLILIFTKCAQDSQLDAQSSLMCEPSKSSQEHRESKAQGRVSETYLVSFPSKKSLNFLVLVIFSRENQPKKFKV